MDEHEKKKLAQIDTKRLWKPWNPSKKLKNLLKSIETYKANLYDLGDSGLTIGYGHFTPKYMYNSKTKENPNYAKVKEQYASGITKESAEKLFEQDLITCAKYKVISELIKVPLYQNEFDAMVSMRFNNPSTTISTYGYLVKNKKRHSTENTTRAHQESMQTQLNRGHYQKTGNTIPTIMNSVKGKWSFGVQNRRDCEKNIFLSNI